MINERVRQHITESTNMYKTEKLRPRTRKNGGEIDKRRESEREEIPYKHL